MNQLTQGHNRHPSLGEALRFWLKLGLISFGGPTGQIAITTARAANDLSPPLGIPRVGLVAHVLAPGVQRIVHHQAVLELLVVVLKDVR